MLGSAPALLTRVPKITRCFSVTVKIRGSEITRKLRKEPHSRITISFNRHSIDGCTLIMYRLDKIFRLHRGSTTRRVKEVRSYLFPRDSRPQITDSCQSFDWISDVMLWRYLASDARNESDTNRSML